MKVENERESVSSDDDQRVFEAIQKAGSSATLAALYKLRDVNAHIVAREMNGYRRRWSHPLGLSLKE